ncbi:hypothetical protein ACTHPH_06030 [Paenibacillus pasadenensis]|uniref:hypothetical protein n=1 Tax=Paenibacillus pasadenensis TaxID=217090 RepID=UPI0004215B66|nr:hypothetical protein [Paenibacillus pasadenensis]
MSGRKRLDDGPKGWRQEPGEADSAAAGDPKKRGAGRLEVGGSGGSGHGGASGPEHVGASRSGHGESSGPEHVGSSGSGHGGASGPEQGGASGSGHGGASRSGHGESSGPERDESALAAAQLAEDRRGLLLWGTLPETAALYPAAVLAAEYAAPALAAPLLWALGALLHGLGGWSGLREAQRGRLGAGRWLSALAAALGAALGWAAVPAGGSAAGIAAAALGALSAAAAMRGRQHGRRRLWLGGDARLALAGLALAAGVYFAGAGIERLLPYRQSLLLFAFAAISLLLLRWNGWQLRRAAHAEDSRHAVTPSIAMLNRRLTLGVVALLGLGVLWLGPLQALLDGLRSLLRRLLSGSTEPPPPATEPPAGATGMPPMPPSEPPPAWLALLSDWFGYLTAAAAAVLALVLLYRLVRRWLPERLRRLLGQLLRWLRLSRELRRPGVETGYVDEVVRLERVGDAQRRGRRSAGGGDPAAGPGGEARRRYRALIAREIGRGYAYRADRTPAEHARELERRLGGDASGGGGGVGNGVGSASGVRGDAVGSARSASGGGGSAGNGGVKSASGVRGGAVGRVGSASGVRGGAGDAEQAAAPGRPAAGPAAASIQRGAASRLARWFGGRGSVDSGAAAPAADSGAELRSANELAELLRQYEAERYGAPAEANRHRPAAMDGPGSVSIGGGASSSGALASGDDDSSDLRD